MLYLYIAFFLSIMNLTAIKILLPEIMTDLDVSLNWLTWVVNAYTLPLAALVSVAGRIGDIYGPRRFFLLGLFCLGAGSLLCGAALSLGWLIAGRVVQALGAAMLVPNSLAILLSKVEDDKRGRALGIWGSIGASGAVIGPVFSGVLADLFSWRGSFVVIAILSLVLVAAAARSMIANREIGTFAKKTGVSFDFPGAVSLMIAIGSLLLALTLLPDLGWQDNLVRVSMLSFVFLIYVFFRIEKVAANPLLNLHLLRKPRFSLGLTVGFLEQFVVAGTMFVMPIFFNTVQGHGAGVTALLLTPAAAAVVVFSPVGGKLADRFGPGLPITAGMTLRALSYFMFILITIDTAYTYIAVGLFLNGVGFALTSTPSLHSVLSNVSRDDHGIASGVHNMIRYTGVAAGTTIGGIVLYALIPVSFEGLTGTIPGFREAYLLAAAACVPGIAAGIYLARLRKH